MLHVCNAFSENYPFMILRQRLGLKRGVGRVGGKGKVKPKVHAGYKLLI